MSLYRVIAALGVCRLSVKPVHDFLTTLTSCGTNWNALQTKPHASCSFPSIENVSLTPRGVGFASLTVAPRAC